MSPSSHSCLVFFPGALGDYLCARPALLGLRARSADGLTVVTHAAYFPLLAADGIQGLSIDRREVADLFATTRPSPDTVQLFGGHGTIHSWTGHGDENFASRLAALSGGSVHVHPFRALRRREHASSYYARCAGVSPRRRPLPLSASARSWASGIVAANEPILAIHAGSGGKHKNWLGMEEIARRWRARYGEIVEISGPSEADRPSPLSARAVRNQPLDRVAAVLDAAALYIGNDSGISHLAAAVGCRGVALFAPTHASHWAPRGGALRTVRSRFHCRACGDAFCLHRLSADAVWQRLLDAASHNPPTSKEARTEKQG